MITTPLGTVLDLVGAAILNTFVASSTVYADRAQKKVRWGVKASTAGGSALTTLTVKCEGSLDGVKWYNVSLTDETWDPAGASDQIASSFAKTLSAAPGTDEYAFSSAGHPYMRFSVEANAAGSSTDEVTVSATLDP